MIELTAENFEKTIADNGKIVVDFWAEWCGPCRAFSPVFDEVAQENASQIAFAKCNIDENSSLADKFGVMAIPTVILLENGEVKKRNTGGMDKTALKNFIAS